MQFRGSPVGNRPNVFPVSPQVPGMPNSFQVRNSPGVNSTIQPVGMNVYSSLTPYNQPQMMQSQKPTPLQTPVMSNLPAQSQVHHQQPLSATMQPNKPIVHSAVSQMTPVQVERIEQPLQVVDLFQVEEPWRRKVQELEAEVARLKGQPTQVQQRYEEKTVYVQDDSKLNELEKELSQAYAQIQQFINTIKILQEDNQHLQQQNEDKSQKIKDLDERMKLLERDLDEAQHVIDDLNAQLDEVQTEQTEKHTYLLTEVNTWKQKFIELNREFHMTQENYMLLQAELDNLKSQGQTSAVKEVITRTETRRKSQAKA